MCPGHSDDKALCLEIFTRRAILLSKTMISIRFWGWKLLEDVKMEVENVRAEANTP